MEKITVKRVLFYAKSRADGDRKVKVQHAYVDWSGLESITDEKAMEAVVFGKLAQLEDYRDIRHSGMAITDKTMLRDSDGTLYTKSYNTLL